jgi:dipeptidyl aminopeptidase/acylaminoacyl peptidase
MLGILAASLCKIRNSIKAKQHFFDSTKSKTPTHLVQDEADVRVSYLEAVMMERALEALGVPHSFLVFPGEGHRLGKNPRHGFIKLREEQNWLEKYGWRNMMEVSAFSRMASRADEL